MNATPGYIKDVQRHLKRRRISLKKAFAAVGYDFFSQWQSAGNMPERTANAIALIIKETK